MDEIAAAIGSGTGAVDRQGLAFEPFDIDGTNDELVAWGEKHMDTMRQRHWPRGTRPR